jgi:phosphoadenosine phosphosulfate reductase
MEYIQHNETIKKLQGIAQKRDTVICAFSGGKDSLVCLDLCCRTFKNVIPFFMYFIPGLECCEIMLRYAEDRWGVKVLQYPHWLLTRVIRNGIYCKPTKKDFAGLPEFTTHDIYKIVMQDTGVRCLVTGAKDSDSMWRRRYFTITKMPELVFPIKAWNKFDVVSYLKRRDIPIPQSSGAAAGGVDLSTGSLLFLYKNYPRDFARIRECFPFIDAVIYREKWYGKEKIKKLSI